MSEASLAAFLETFKGASFISCVTETEPKLNARHRETREPNPYIGRIKRHAVRPGMIGASYEQAVQNRREKEGHVGASEGEKFDALSMWNGAGEHVSPALVRHKTTSKLYMVLYPRNTDTGEVVVTDSEWTCDGEPIALSALKPYLPPVKEGAPRQETAKPVPWRVVGLESIVSLTVQGETYTITH